jgi:hypothetical protein
MKVIKNLRRVALAGSLLAVIMTPLSSQPRSKDPLTQAVHVNLDRVSTPDAVSQTLLDAGVPGGITALHYCGGFPMRSLKPSSNSVRGILDAVVSTDPSYVWRLDDGAVNVIPRYTKIHFLETRVSRLELKEVKTPDEALNILMQQPEVQRQAKNELGLRLVEGFAYAFLTNATVDSQRENTLSMELNNTTVAEALNAIAKAYRNAVWVLVKNECNNGGRKSFSIKFIYH